MDRAAVITVDLSAVTSSRQLHLTLRDALGFPDWYGCNWDAFWDAISGLVSLPFHIQFVGWPVLCQRLPEDARLMKECLARMTVQYPESAADVGFD